MVECNRGCGATSLRWKVVNGSYKLFNHNDLLHICNDGVEAPEDKQKIATAKILSELGIAEPAQIPSADHKPNHKGLVEVETDPAKMFTITGTASGLAITGDDKHNAIYLPKVAITEIIKALVDFI